MSKTYAIFAKKGTVHCAASETPVWAVRTTKKESVHRTADAGQKNRKTLPSFTIPDIIQKGVRPMENKYKSQDKYDAANTKKFGLKLNRKTDAGIIEKLSAENSIQGYIKELINRDLKSPPFLRVIGKKISDDFTLLEIGSTYSDTSYFRYARMSKTDPDSGEIVHITVKEPQDEKGAVVVILNEEVVEKFDADNHI